MLTESEMTNSQYGQFIPIFPFFWQTNLHFSSFHEREISDFMIGKDI